MADVTVLIATIPGREDLLTRALASIADQSRMPDEVVVEADPEFTGAAKTRNRALEHVITDYVAILDDDDWLLPNHIEVLMKVAERDSWLDLVYPVPEIRNMADPTMVELRGRKRRPWGLPWTEGHRQYLVQRNNFIPVTVLMRTDSLKSIGGFQENPRLSPCEDWLTFRKMALQGMRFYHVNEKTWVWEKV